jgi:hypothetical protein
MVLTSCFRLCNARHSPSTGHTKPGSPGRSPAPTCSITSGSNGSNSTRPNIGSDSTEGCGRRIASPTSSRFHPSGAVSDSGAVATGAILRGTIARHYAVTLDLLGLASRHVPDRSVPELSRDGTGFFGRVAAERAGWRGHVIFWRGSDFIKDEGDLNYQSVARNGDRYRGTRDYSEAGLTRRFTLARAAVLDVSGRLHRVEGRYEYSFRILSAVSAFWKLR